MRLNVVARVPWSADVGVPEVFVPAPQTGIFVEASPLIRAPVRARVAPDGEIRLLAYESLGGRMMLGRLNPPRAILGWHVASGQVVDFVATSHGGTVLLENKLGTGFLNVLDESGSQSAINLPDYLRDQTTGLLSDGEGNVYLAATRRAGLVFRVHTARRQVEPFAEWTWGGGPLVMDPAARLHFPSLDPSSGTRSWVELDPLSNQLREHVCADELYEFLTNPIGVTADGYAVASSGYAVRRFTKNCQPDWKEELDNIVEDDDHRLWVSGPSRGETPAVRLRCWRIGKVEPETEMTLELPSDRAQGRWRLVSIGPNQEFIVSCGHSATSEHWAAFKSSGKLIDQLPQSWKYPSASFELQPPGDWILNREGHLWLPLLSPDGFLLLELSIQ